MHLGMRAMRRKSHRQATMQRFDLEDPWDAAAIAESAAVILGNALV